MKIAPSCLLNRCLSAGLAIIVAALAITPASAVIVANTVDARFVQVINNGPANRLLGIGELEVFSAPGGLNGHVPGNNANLGNSFDLARTAAGASIQSTTGGGGHGAASAVIDGLEQTGGTTWTKQAVGAQVTVNLGGTFSLNTVRVHQRNDGCCQDRLSDFTVNFLADNAGSPGATVLSQSVPGQAPTNLFSELNLGVTILPGGNGAVGTETTALTSGRYVQVINNGDVQRALHVGELEVFELGTPAGPNANNGGNNSPLNNPNDLALTANGATIESASNSGGHGNVLAVIDGLEQTGGTTWTKQEAVGGGSQVTVDLGGTFDVDAVRVHQRNDGCCQERLQSFTLNLFDDAGGTPGALVNSIDVPGFAPTNLFQEVSFATFNIGSNDILSIELDPNAMSADLLQVGASGNGALTIDSGAILELTLLNFGVAAGSTQTFNILDFGSLTGAFSAINFTNLPDRFRFDSSNLLIDGTIAVTNVPEPTSAMLALMGIAGIAARRRRRSA